MSPRKQFKAEVTASTQPSEITSVGLAVATLQIIFLPRITDGAMPGFSSLSVTDSPSFHSPLKIGIDPLVFLLLNVN